MKNNNTSTLICIFVLIITFTFLIMGSYKPLIVLSGSMNPIMKPGDMVIMTPTTPEDIIVGDIIIYTDPSGTLNKVITHRVIEITDSDDLTFQTKGDANEDKDNYQVPAANIVGESVFVIPAIGYLPNLLKTPFVFVFLVIIPGATIMIDELLSIMKYSNPLRAHKAEKDAKKNTRKISREINYTYIIGIVLISILVLFLLFIPYFQVPVVNHLYDEFTIENPGLFPGTYIVSHGNTNIYGIIPSHQSVSVPLGDSTLNSVYLSPCLIPVFWTDILTKISPISPVIFIILSITFLTTLSFLPVWYRKPTFTSRKQKLNITKKIKLFKRTILN